ncbi:MAG: hypothetical protein QNJ37_04695 [Crocosphaera sp.]|nr:hypothetical protein [Crocosphaera sp.]
MNKDEIKKALYLLILVSKTAEILEDKTVIPTELYKDVCKMSQRILGVSSNTLILPKNTPEVIELCLDETDMLEPWDNYDFDDLSNSKQVFWTKSDKEKTKNPRYIREDLFI